MRLPLKVEVEPVPGSELPEVLEILYHLPADAEGVARGADDLCLLAQDKELHLRITGKPTHHTAVHRDRRDRGARCPVDLVRLAPQGYKRLEPELVVDGPDLLIQGELRVRVDALGKGRDPLLEARRGLGKGDGHGAGDHVGKRGEPLLDVLKGLTGLQLQDGVLGDHGLKDLQARLVRHDVASRQHGLLRVARALCLGLVLVLCICEEGGYLPLHVRLRPGVDGQSGPAPRLQHGLHHGVLRK